MYDRVCSAILAHQPELESYPFATFVSTRSNKTAAVSSIKVVVVRRAENAGTTKQIELSLYSVIPNLTGHVRAFHLEMKLR